MPGFHNWYIRKRFVDRNGWTNWNYIKCDDGMWMAVADKHEATPFKVREDAERAAFNLTIREPDLIANLIVELV